MKCTAWLLVAMISATTAGGAEPPPQVADPRLAIELVAESPEIVTPTGIDVDQTGRVWVIENHTHFRPDDYEGPASDRVRVLDQFDAAGRATRLRTFAEDLSDSMSIMLLAEGEVLLATRGEILLLRDTDGDLAADDRRALVRLDTPGDYPHNGLSGFARDHRGDIYFSLGENLGETYVLIGADGTMLSGGGEGGNIYRMRPDGSGLAQVATGFWNTFHVGFDAFGRLFAVDNDPDSRPPCRLLHVVEGGDYGYRFRNGRKGLHPFTAWDGELPGTLPMIAGTGEAPSGVIAYESDGLPAEFRGALLVTSWGDHLLQRFRLEPHGASFTAQAESIVQGDENFRPVGIAMGPDGAVYLSDWVDESYPLHGKGRIWRLRSRDVAKDSDNSTERPLDHEQASELPTENLSELLSHPHQPTRRAAARALAQRAEPGAAALMDAVKSDEDARARVEALWAAERVSSDTAAEAAKLALEDSDEAVRAAAVEQLARHDSEQAEAILAEKAIRDPSPQVRRAALARLTQRESLEGVVDWAADADPFIATAVTHALAVGRQTELIDRLLSDDKPERRLAGLLALRRLEDEAAVEKLPALLRDDDPGVRRAAIQWVAEAQLDGLRQQAEAAVAKPPVDAELLQGYLAAAEMLSRRDDEDLDELSGEAYLLRMVADSDQSADLRALALRNLDPAHEELTLELLDPLLAGGEPQLRQEAIRTLAARADEASQRRLRRLAAANAGAIDLPERAEAVMGLALSASESEATRNLLLRLVNRGPKPLQNEAIRSLRAAVNAPLVRSTLTELLYRAQQSVEQEVRLEGGQDTPAGVARRELVAQLELALAAHNAGEDRNTAPDSSAPVVPDVQRLLDEQGDAAAGRRVFFHAQGPRCFACHRAGGRGGNVGPDLSLLGGTRSREQIIQSLLEPSREVAPQFMTYTVALTDGRLLTGVVVAQRPDGSVDLADAQGKIISLKADEIDQQTPQRQSIMPDDVHRLMTHRELLDLVEFLTQLR
ncbi:MAG: PVC-type heme-binding CxxCH protein [Pirellulales bacterium]